MVLKECYYVCYYIVNYSEEGKTELHEDAYLNYTNALLVAKELTKCRDLSGIVSVIDGSTGEVLDEFEKDEAVASTAEKTDNAAINNDNGFEDGTGGTWYLTQDGEWSYDCLGLTCSRCAYCEEHHCLVRDSVTKEERDIQIKSARKRMRK